ncbi:MAG: SpoIIE family protein phosphatase [Solirubrobacterales bacterium]
MAAGLVALAILVALDVALGEQASALVGTYVAAPFIAAILAGPGATVFIGAVAVAAAAASPGSAASLNDTEQLVGVAVIAVGTALAALGSWIGMRMRDRSDRLRLLDAVGGVADGSLPLSETLERVVEVIVPGFADLCMVDATHEGRVTRIAVRSRGRDDAAEIEDYIRRRPPTIPSWLLQGDRAWRHIPRWVPRVRDEELRRMSHSGDDLGFLRGLEMRSIIWAPVVARDRSLGVLTLVTGWSGRRYSLNDLRFARILASRIGLALDNAGLFSDLESVERRMDTVMSILDEAVVIHGPDGELLFANPAAARTLGFETAEEAVSTPTARIRDRYVVRDEAGRPVEAESFVGRRALRGEHADSLILRSTDRVTGEERWTRTKARAIAGPDGRILYSVTAIEDVTDVKRAELAQRLQARLGQMISDSDDYTEMLERIPRLLIGEFADWCSVNVVRPDGLVEQVAISHDDPEALARARQMRDRHPVRIDDPTGIGAVIRTGEPRLFVDADDLIREIAADDRHLREMHDSRPRSVIIAPMPASGGPAGALAFVNREGSRVFDSDDLELAVELARRAGLAIEGAQLADERARVADALQRELLPPSLPTMAGWEVATMYEPAGVVNEVGGDFYEVFPVEGGWAVVLGDVSGRGAAAASLTAEARHTIRTAGTLAGDPRAGLRMLDRNLRGRDDAALCSIVVAVIPDGGPEPAEAEIYLAGHPHPIFIREGSVEEVGSPGPLLGIVEDPDWPPAPVSLRPGDQLILNTDGVIEARREAGDRFGTQRLRDQLVGCESPEAAVGRVRSALQTFRGTSRQDDAAVVAIRYAGSRAAAPRQDPEALAAP